MIEVETIEIDLRVYFLEEANVYICINTFNNSSLSQVCLNVG